MAVTGPHGCHWPPCLFRCPLLRSGKAKVALDGPHLLRWLIPMRGTRGWVWRGFADLESLCNPPLSFFGGRRGGRWGMRMAGVAFIYPVAVVVPLPCCRPLGSSLVSLSSQRRGAVGLSGLSGRPRCVSSHPWQFLCSLKVWRPRLLLIKAEALLKREHPLRMLLALDMSERGCFLLPTTPLFFLVFANLKKNLRFLLTTKPLM